MNSAMPALTSLRNTGGGNIAVFGWLGFFILVAMGQFSLPLMVFDKTRIAEGEYWRLITGHITHSSFSHAFWDVLAFIFSVYWLNRYSRKALVFSLVFGTVFIDIFLLSDFSSLTRYCGLSGLLFSPLIAAALFFFLSYRGLFGFAPLIIILLKVVFDVSSNETWLVATDWQAYPEAHILGVLAGLVTFSIIIPLRNK